MEGKKKNEFARLKSKVFLRGFGIVVLSFIVISIIYTLLWRGHGGEWLVSMFQSLFKMDYENALNLYQQLVRNNMGIVWGGSILVVFLILYYAMLTWFIRYFNQINQGIDALLKNEAGEIALPSEMSAVEKKLNTVRQTLDRRAVEAKLAEQRKNDLIMYLAHDIRTPLTSVIGYLSLLFNAKSRAAEIAAFMDQYIPAVERMYNLMKKYQVAFTETTMENKKLKQKNTQLEQSLEKATQESTLKQLADAKLRRDYADAVAVLDRIPKEVLDVYTRGSGRKERPIEQNL